jgi:two-component system NarL family sensor kinase
MPDLLTRFGATLSPPEADLLNEAAEYARWQSGHQGGEFTLGGSDDVEIRNYLLDLRIRGADGERLARSRDALRRFYAWAAAEGLIDANPFEEYDFDRPLLGRDQIRRRPDVLGAGPADRELARLHALNRLADQLNRAAGLQTALDVTLATLADALGLQAAWVFLLTDAGLTTYLPQAPPAPHDFALCAAHGLPPALEQQGRLYLRQPGDCQCQHLLRQGQLRRAVNIVECTRVQDAAETEADNRGLLFHASVPLVLHGRPVGIINVATEEWQFLGAADLQFLSAAGAQASATLERARLFARSLELGAMEERVRLAREIHDTLAQGLTAITLNLETAEALLEADGDPDRLRQAVRHALAQAHASLEEARRSVMDLRAAPLEGRTLAEALDALARQRPPEAGWPAATFEAEGQGQPLPHRVEAGLYRIAQEALANARNHARARRIHVRLVTTPDEARLSVDDDGRGFDPAAAPPGRYGLIGLSERARLLGGRLRLESSPGEGTRVEVVVPLNAA